jgi:hypothetical protein
MTFSNMFSSFITFLTNSGSAENAQKSTGLYGKGGKTIEEGGKYVKEKVKGQEPSHN